MKAGRTIDQALADMLDATCQALLSNKKQQLVLTGQAVGGTRMGQERWWAQEDPPGSGQGTLLKGLGIGCATTFALVVFSWLVWPAFFAPPIVVAFVTKRYHDVGETQTAKGIFVSTAVSYSIAVLFVIALIGPLERDM